MTEPEKALRVLNEVKYLTLATLNDDGSPWVSTLFFAFDKDLNFYWASKKDCLHSSNINRDPRVAANIYWLGHDGEDDVDALYIKAQAHEITSLPEVIQTLTPYGKRLFDAKFITQQGYKLLLTQTKDFFSKAPLRLYKAVPTHIYKWVIAPNWKDHYIDGRIEIPVEEIRKLL